MSYIRNNCSLTRFFEAVLDLQDIFPDKCPACDTPLQGDVTVVSNPFVRANQELKNLAHLSKLELKFEETKRTYDEASKQLFSAVQAILSYASRLNHHVDTISKISRAIPSQVEQLNRCWWYVLMDAVCDDSSNSVVPLELLGNISEEIERYDKEIEQANAKSEQYKNELTELRQLREEIVGLETTRNQAEERIMKAEQSVQLFDEQNKSLIKAVEDEKHKIELNRRIATAYQELMRQLGEYRNGLPSKLLADLSETTEILYNGFNRADPPGDLIADLKLPLSSGQKIKAAYESNPEKYFDALNVMSEGHIRCLGLAILMAKNIKLKCPFLLFDDPVNAIDDYHREGIRRTLFEDNHFSDAQIILTCHGEEFYKDIQNIIGAAEVNRA